MAKLTLTGEKVKIIRQDREYNGNTMTSYSMMVSSKDSNDEWHNAFVPCRFKKGVSLENKTLINIKNAFPTVNSYKDKSGTERAEVKWMITEYELDGASAPANANVNLDADGFMVIPDGIDEELPFN